MMINTVHWLQYMRCQLQQQLNCTRVETQPQYEDPQCFPAPPVETQPHICNTKTPDAFPRRKRKLHHDWTRRPLTDADSQSKSLFLECSAGGGHLRTTYTFIYWTCWQGDVRNKCTRPFILPKSSAGRPACIPQVVLQTFNSPRASGRAWKCTPGFSDADHC